MKIVITGAGGYIGSVSTQQFLGKGYEVVAIDNFSTGFRQPLEVLQKKYPQKLQVYDQNIAEGVGDIFNREGNIEAVIHYAGNCSVNESMNEPNKYFFNNSFASLALLNAMQEAGISFIVFSSTCAVYGEVKKVPIPESHPTYPTNPYGASKKMTEEMIQWFAQIKGLNYMILRYFNVSGATDDGEIGDSKKPSVHLVQNAVRGALEIEPFFLTCPKVNTPDETPIRDYVNVVDLNEAHILALEHIINGGKSEILNIGTGVGNSVFEILEAVERQTGVSIPLHKSYVRQGEYARAVADITHAKKVLGWKPAHSIDDSIKSLISWYKKHPHGWKQ
jgi:UDP-glucose 4-epimerase